jgi:P27 family predicted phage terminase small subunit
VAKPGPRPAPSAIREARGQRPDRLNPAEPAPARGDGPPEPPESLCPEAQAKWRRLAPDLWAKGVLTPWDTEILAAYCDLAYQVERIREKLKSGLVVRGRRDGLVTSPTWRIYREALGLLRLYAVELGLTPAARSQIRALPPPELGAEAAGA